MKKRIAALILACVLMTVPVLAAENTADNFTRTRTYAGEFSDLTSDSPFYENVTALYEYGLTVGKGDGTFGLTDTMTVGQIVIFAGRIHSLYRTGDPEAGAAAQGGDGTTAEPYLHYLQAEGALGTELDGLLTTTATRAQVAHVLANTLPEGVLTKINDAQVTEGYASRRYITDVTEYTPYYQDILLLYRWGISQGSDETGSFYPDQPITRGAAAAMLTRLLDPELRLTLEWDVPLANSAVGTTLASLVEPGTYIASPQTEAEMDESVRHMLSSGDHTLTLSYSDISMIGARQKMQEALAVVKSYCEQSYNTVSCAIMPDGRLRMTFSAGGAGSRLEEYRTATMEAAIAVHDQLWESGELTASMTETEKARVYYTWICDNCVYDYGAGDESLSHIAYNLFCNGKAVCDGYTGAYNLLLKLEGISCTSLSNEGHIWTVAELDGQQVHIDTTWGDSGSQIDYDYFAMTPEESWQAHAW